MKRENCIDFLTKVVNVTADTINTATDFVSSKIEEAKEKTNKQETSEREINFVDATQSQKELIMLLANNLKNIKEETIIQCRDIIVKQLELSVSENKEETTVQEETKVVDAVWNEVKDGEM